MGRFRDFRALIVVLTCGCVGILLAIIEQILTEQALLITLAGTQVADPNVLVAIQTCTIIVCLLIGLIIAALG